jgi:hypothetical protein
MILDHLEAQRRISREQQSKFATDPTSVPTEIDDRDIAVLERSGEAGERVLESWAVRVDHKLRGEAELRQPIMDGTGITNWPDDTLELSIFRYADHECTALALSRSAALQRQNGQ